MALAEVVEVVEWGEGVGPKLDIDDSAQHALKQHKIIINNYSTSPLPSISG